MGCKRNAWCDLYALKTDSAGTILWTKILDIPHEQQGSGIKQTTDGGYIVVGTATFKEVHRFNIWLLKLAADNMLDITDNNQAVIN